MATFRTSQWCQDGEENSKCYEWRCQGGAFKDALENLNAQKEHIKNSSNRYFIKKLVNLSQILWSKPFSGWYLHENSPSKDRTFKVHITPCKVIRLPESGKFCSIQYLESRIHGVESRIQDCLAFHYIMWHTNHNELYWHSELTTK